MKLATNVRSDKGFLLTSKVCPQGVFCPGPGAIYMYEIIKNVYRIRFRKDHFELATYGQHSVVVNFLPLSGLSAPAWGYIHVKKTHIKKGKKSDFKEIFFLNWQQMGKVIRNFCWHQNFVPKGIVCTCPGAIYMYKSIKIYTRTRCQVSVHRTTGPPVPMFMKILYIFWYILRFVPTVAFSLQ